MAKADEKRETRSKFLEQVYRLCDGNPLTAVPYRQPGEELGISEEESLGIITYLKDSGLVEWPHSGHISITNWGIREVESTSQEPEAEKSACIVDIFISHSSLDKAIAEAFVELLRQSLNLAPRQIRCTSVQGHKLPLGAATEQQLRREILDAPVLIGLISEASIGSAYVLFELGARWGAEKAIFPVLCAGAGPEHLAGPLANRNALECNEEGSVHQIVADIADELGREVSPASAYLEALRELVHINRFPPVDQDPRLEVRTTPKSTPEARRQQVTGVVLLEATVGSDGRARDFKVLKGLGYGLEEVAIKEIAEGWRFKPAMRSDKPVPYRCVFEIDFR